MTLLGGAEFKFHDGDSNFRSTFSASSAFSSRAPLPWKRPLPPPFPPSTSATAPPHLFTTSVHRRTLYQVIQREGSICKVA